MKISLINCTVELSETYSLGEINLSIESGQHYAILGPNGAGKSALMSSLAGEGKVKSGEVKGLPERVQMVSLEVQRELIERERERDVSDLTDDVFEGTPVAEIIGELNPDPSLLTELVDLFDIKPLMTHGFRSLSTGESRKVLLVRALASNPALLLLDEPFEGLDEGSSKVLAGLLDQAADRMVIVLVLNRLSEIPAFVTRLVYMDTGRIEHFVDNQDETAVSDLQQLLHLKTSDLKIPVADPSEKIPLLDGTEPLVRMRDARVAYGDSVIFEKLDWIVRPGQHWQVTGPNGSGKTCLLNLITGDHPQCYINDIFVFGFQRGQGESIWEIKQHIGYVSTALQWEYRVSINLKNVVISGFYDSIGLYQTATDTQKQIADDWLDLLGMKDRADQPFNQLSYGDQRLLLIARAMVKHPHMLILDEPCLGLDDINRHLVLALVEKICADSETTVIYVNHHTEDRIRGIENHLSLADT